MGARHVVRSVAAFAAAVVLFAACEHSVSAVAASLRAGVTDTTFALRVGQEARLADTVLRFTFLSVTNDSRCPSDVVCVWAGDAAVQVGIAWGSGPTVPYLVHTALDPRSVNAGGYRLTLVDLRPYPVSTSTIPPGSYVATFRLQLVGYPPD